MINVRLNYLLLQVINAAFLILSYLFVTDYFDLDGTRTLGRFLIGLAVILAGVWAFYTNRIFYLLIKRGEG